MKLSLAIALALAGSNAFALGLGTIQVKSGLNQPLDAEIPVLTESATEATELTVDLASAEDFERVGLNRARLSVPIEMAVTTNARGQTVIKVTTKEAVREPLIDFLIVANWTKGKVLREYTVLLDPPITAPARGSTATVAPVAETPAPKPQPLAESKVPPKPARPEPKPPVAAAPQKPQKPAKAAPAPAPAAPPPKAAAPAATGNDYGPVAQGETLSEIARATLPDEKTNINQMMLALLKANPKAFYQDNINALKRGAILRIPSSDDIKATGAVRDAVAQVHSQNEAWVSKAPVTAPTLVAHTGAATKTEPAAPAKPAKSEAAAKKEQERLALVPPRAGKGDTGSDRAGAAGGTSKETAEVKAELARTKEALSSREQEATELKSRVKQLEDLSSKDQRLISMKDSEIAELQAKLKELQAKSATGAAAAQAAKPAAETPATAGKPEQKVTAKDIWGDMSGADKTAAGKPAAGTPAAATPAPSATTPGAATTPAPTAATPTAPSATPPATAATGTTPSATAPGAATPSPSASTSTTAVPTTTAPAASTPTAPSADSGASTSKPAAETAPVKSAPPAKIAPLEPAAEPFYKNQNVLLGGGAALLLVGLLALMRFMRKPKPFVAGGTAEPEGELGTDAAHEEEHLLDTLRQDPGNTAASLELLRHYYARGDAGRFEAAAEQMHAHLMDPGAPEWDEVLAMGAVLAPHNPLFGEGMSAVGEGEHAHAEPHDEFVFTEPMHTQSGTFDERPMHTGTETHAAEERFDYDLPIRAEETPPEVETLRHETLPDFTRPDLRAADRAVEQTAEPPMVAAPADELLIGEDAIGTKLDLAKAYLDMGDPEGARSMLDEVMSEGNDTQKDEARKLLAEIK